MSKLQKLQQELRYADQAKVSTAQLRQRLNEIIAQTSNADVVFKHDPRATGLHIVRTATNPLTKQIRSQYYVDPPYSLSYYQSMTQDGLSRRERALTDLMNSKEFKDVHYITNLRIVPEERQPKFRPRIYEGPQSLTTKSDPRLLVNVVNNLKKAMQRRGNSSAPIGRGAGDFFANILRRGEE